MHILIVLLFFALTLTAASPPCLVCQKSLEETATATLNYSLKKLSNEDGPYYRLVKLNSVNTEVVRGLLYKINADIIDQKNNIKSCDIEIFDFKDVTVTFKCPGESIVIKTHT
ncbi:sarcocystatin-A-like [Musca autumnalis]|uniref:sarcocystatin-A-like n=1 Tax=Musca autumnalis TaxID=221902 RepID=UPI003CF42D3D